MNMDLKTIADNLTQDISNKYKTSRDKRNVSTIEKIFQFNLIDHGDSIFQEQVFQTNKNNLKKIMNDNVLEYIKSKISQDNAAEYSYKKTTDSYNLYHCIVSELYKYSLDLIKNSYFIPETLTLLINVNFKKLLLSYVKTYVGADKLTFNIIYDNKPIEINITDYIKKEHDPDIIIFYPDSFLFTISEYIHCPNSLSEYIHCPNSFILNSYKDNRSNPTAITFIPREV